MTTIEPSENSAIDIQTMQRVLEEKPAAKIKSIIDIVNMTTVNQDIMRTRKNRTEFEKVWSALTGKSHDEQQMLLENISAQVKILNETNNVLFNNDTHLFNAVSIIIEKLEETRKGQMWIYSAYAEHKKETEEGIALLKTMQKKQDERINKLNMRTEALNEIDGEFGRLNKGMYDTFTLAERLKLTLENLYLGATGYVMKRENGTYRENMRDRIERELIEYLERVFTKKYFNREDLFRPTRVKTDSDRFFIGLMFNYNQPIADAIWKVNRNGYEILETDLHDDLSFLIKRDRLAENLYSEITRPRIYKYA